MASADGRNGVLPVEEEKLVRHMSYEGHRCLSELLRPHDVGGQDWKGLAVKLGFTYQKIINLKEERYPVEVMLNKCPDLTISKLKSSLVEMERLDVLEVLEPFEGKV
jgi:hypothetical protein